MFRKKKAFRDRIIFALKARQVARMEFLNDSENP